MFGGSVPEGLAEMAPGPELGVVLAGVDRDSLSGFDRVVVLQARAAQLAHDHAQFYADVLSVWDGEREVGGGDGWWTSDLDELAAAEIRAALSLTRRSADFHVDVALGLARLPQVWEMLDRGLIDLPKARVICDQTSHLDAELAGQVADQALERASTQTTGQLRTRIQRLCISVDPESAKNSYEKGVEERRVAVVANPDGTANLYGLDLPVDRAHAAMSRVNQLARTLKTSEDARSMDQIAPTSS